jgi:hypothetical protein
VRRNGRISLRAKSVRLGLSWFVKRRARHETLEQSRRRFLAMEALIPHPPRDTETITINAGGVSADRVITPASRPNRHVLYLHGGAYRLGAPSPSLRRKKAARVFRRLRRTTLCHSMPGARAVHHINRCRCIETKYYSISDNSTDIHGTHVPVEEPSTASKAEVDRARSTRSDFPLGFDLRQVVRT